MNGSGTLADPYQITDVDDLQDMTVDRTACYILMNDIDASGTDDWNTNGDGTYDGFEPIGMETAAPFSGCLDGNGHKITGIHINKYESTGSLYTSLLGYCKGTAQNCLANGEITGSAASWTLGSQWEYNADTIRLIANSGGTLSQALVDMTEQFVPGEEYVIRFSASGITGTIAASAAGVSFGDITTTLKVQFKAVSNTPLVLTPSASARVTINGIYISRVSFVRDLTIENPSIYINGNGGNAAVIANQFVVDGGMYISAITVENVTITGATITSICTGSINPLIGGAFGYMAGVANIDNGGVVTNCDISDITISQTAGQNSTGGFVLEANQDIVFTDCTVTGSITTYGTMISTTARSIGGFAADLTAFGAKFNHCYANVNITDTVIGTGNLEIGGFVGGHYLQYHTAVCTDCVAAGNIYTTHSKIAAIGGFFARAGEGERCAATGNITAKYLISTSASVYSEIGGFANTSICVDCYSQGKVLIGGNNQDSANTHIGGFFGNAGIYTAKTCYTRSEIYPALSGAGAFSSDSFTATACYFDIDACGYSNALKGGTGNVTGIVGKQSVQMQSMYSYDPLGSEQGEWDFNTVWEFSTFANPGISPSNLTVWPSKTGDYENFEAGVKDDDSFQLTIPSTNEIRWIDSQESLIVGTAGDEWKIGSNKLGTPLSPTNFGVKRQSGHGSAYIQSIQINEVILFVDYVKRKIREMTYDMNSEKYVCPDLTALAEHITKGQIKWMAYQRNPNSILWVGLETGKVRGFVYDREQNVTAWFKVPLGGNGLAQSGCVIPGITEDSVYLVVNRSFVGSIIYYDGEIVTCDDLTVVDSFGDKAYLEKFSARELSLAEDAFFVDCGITFETSGEWIDEPVLDGTTPVVYGTEDVVYNLFDTTAPTYTVTGLDHLEGETVSILADGVVIDDQVVSGAKITLTTPAYKVNVGLPYTSKLQPMRIVMGNAAGTSMGSTTRVNNLKVSLHDSGAAQYGSQDSDLYDMDLNSVNATNSSEIDGLFTGELSVEMPGGFDPLNPIIISTDKPVPLTVRCIVADVVKTG